MWTQEPTSLAPSAPVASVEPWRYGGHRGGGKRRKDGLISGTPEAIAANRAKDAARKRAARAALDAYAVPEQNGQGYAPPQNYPPATTSGNVAIFVFVTALVAMVADTIATMKKLDAIAANNTNNQPPKNRFF